MEEFLYFSFGSNMLIERLRDRCSTAKLVGIAVARGYELQFNKKSRDESGKANLILADSNRSAAWGGIFTIAMGEREQLDRYEGRGHGYDRIDDFCVYRMDTHSYTRVNTYIASETNSSLCPYDWYLMLVLSGAIQNELPGEYIEELRGVPRIPDPCNKRKSRVSAVKILKCSGFDYLSENIE